MYHPVCELDRKALNVLVVHRDAGNLMHDDRKLMYIVHVRDVLDCSVPIGVVNMQSQIVGTDVVNKTEEFSNPGVALSISGAAWTTKLLAFLPQLEDLVTPNAGSLFRRDLQNK